MYKRQVFQKAREENKLVFMDCYTSWCGPCKKMLKEVFSRKDIGEYMNTRFVNYKQDMEQEEGKELAGKYGVKVYPTFFILDAAGEVRHKMVGGMTAEEFLKQVQLGSGENSLYAFNPVSYTHLDVYKRQDFFPISLIRGLLTMN